MSVTRCSRVAVPPTTSVKRRCSQRRFICRADLTTVSVRSRPTTPFHGVSASSELSSSSKSSTRLKALENMARQPSTHTMTPTNPNNMMTPGENRPFCSAGSAVVLWHPLAGTLHTHRPVGGEHILPAGHIAPLHLFSKSQCSPA